MILHVDWIFRVTLSPIISRLLFGLYFHTPLINDFQQPISIVVEVITCSELTSLSLHGVRSKSNTRGFLYMS